jgi:hypothetical protein
MRNRKANCHRSQWHRYWYRYIRFLPRPRVMHIVHRRNHISVWMKAIRPVVVCARERWGSPSMACITLKARWVLLRSMHMLALLRNGCVDLLQLARIQSLRTEQVADAVVVCHMVHKATAFGTCRVTSVKPTVTGVIVSAPIAKSVTAGQDDDGIYWMLHANRTPELIYPHDPLTYVLWYVLFIQIDSSSIEYWSHAPMHIHRARDVRLIHDM